MRRRSCASTSLKPRSRAPEGAPLDLGATAAYAYDLPDELIARAPADPPDAARLLVVGPGAPEHRTFADFPSLLRKGDVLVINETRVIRARLFGTRVPGRGKAEILLLRPADRPRFASEARRWRALVRPGRKLPPGARVALGDDGVVTVVAAAEGGVREVELDLRAPLEDVLERHGELPLPPYVGPGTPERAARYQTIFARVPGSVAAPTASLHFTPRTLEALRERGVIVVPLTLDVGLGTFAPIAAARIAEHEMHGEHFSIPPQTAAAIGAARREGRRVVAAGTTVLRALESAADDEGAVAAGEAETHLFVRPGFRFRAVDVLLTNFHLPGSTLLVLVCAFAGYERTMHAYEEAVRAGYRFFSFGDASLFERAHSSLLPERGAPARTDIKEKKHKE
jgi:S-adenosylmethionine:tRNA ribosyltransferase-isomerase